VADARSAIEGGYGGASLVALWVFFVR